MQTLFLTCIAVHTHKFIQILQQLWGHNPRIPMLFFHILSGCRRSLDVWLLWLFLFLCVLYLIILVMVTVLHWSGLMLVTSSILYNYNKGFLYYSITHMQNNSQRQYPEVKPWSAVIALKVTSCKCCSLNIQSGFIIHHNLNVPQSHNPSALFEVKWHDLL